MNQKKTFTEIQKELTEAKSFIKVGGIYSHYKHPENTYEVISLAIQEATNKLCVIYKPLYGESNELLFVRDLDIWLETVEKNGKMVERFKLIK